MIQAVPEAGSALIFTNVKLDGHNKLVADPSTVHAAEPPIGKGVVKYGVNIWFRGASWGGIIPHLVVASKFLVPHSIRWIWPSGLGSDLCLFCGAPLISEENRWDVNVHAHKCLFREQLSRVDFTKCADLIIKVDKCDVQFVYSKRLDQDYCPRH